VEKMTSQTTPKVTEILASAGDTCGEVRAGATFPALFAMIARRHMYQYGTTRQHLAAVAVKNHANGALNPQAHMRKVITMEQALNGKPISDPLTVYDCSLISDGAAAVLIAPLERASEFTDKPVKVLGIAQTSDHLALDEKEDITTLRAVVEAAKKAYRMAGVTAADIQFAEVHDCFTIAELLVYEAIGLAPQGQGARAIEDGIVDKDGKLPINPSGGLKAKGHPIGATGVSMHAIASMQLTDRAGDMQIKGARLGGIFNMGGAAVANYVSILERLR